MITKQQVYDEKRHHRYQKLAENYNLPKNGTVHKMKITPTLAKRMLELVPPFQRKLLPRQVKSLGVALVMGEFQFTGDSICFDEWGNCINGQQRLATSREQNKPIVCNVTTGFDGLKAYKVMDVYWRKKGFKDMLRYQGEPNCIALAAMIIWLYRYKKGLPGHYSSPIPTTQMGLELLEKNPDIRDSIIYARKFKKDIITPAIAGCCHYLCSHKDKEQSNEFYTHLADGTELTINNPIYQCRRALQDEYIKGITGYERMRGEYKFGMVLKTWNAWRFGKRLRSARTLRYNSNEPFPNPA